VNAADFRSMQLPEALRLLSEMPGIMHAAIAGMSLDEIRRRPSHGGFSLVEHACHLRDLEREGYAMRLRRMLEQDHPALAGFEGDVVARERDYLAQDPANAVAEFAIARRALLARAEVLTPAEMARTAGFMSRTITVCDLLAMMVEHDSGHRREIAELVATRSA
jgi:hypothetical protein